MSWVNRDTFSPALDSAHSIDVPASARAGSVSLLLRARLGSAQVVAQIARERVQVQAWTNAPIDGVRDGEWRAYPFAPPDGNEEATTSAAAGDAQYDFALDPAESSELDEPHPHTMLLRLKLRPLPANASTARFSITYRLVYPDGGIWWLGSAGHDAGCLIRRADPWLAVPQKAEQVVKGEEEGEEGLEVFRDVCMKETWGCWSIAHGRIEYHAQGTPTPPDASILILVPRPTAPTLALHHAIILHSARLRLTPGPHQRVLSTPGTRVYTAHAASAELAVALPALGLRWLGMHNGLALIAAPPAPADGSARIAAVPLLFDPATPPGILRVDLPTCFPANDDDDAARHLQADGYAVYAPASRRVVGIDGPQVRLKVAHVGGTALVSAMHALPVIDGASGAEAAWRIAVLTPHALVLGVPEHEQEHDHDHDHDHEAEHKRDEEPVPKPTVAPAPVPITPPAAVPNPRPKPTTTETATQATPDRRSFPRRIIAYVLPLVWRTVALLCRAVLVRVFGLVGLHPPSLLLSILALALPDSKEPRREVPYVVRRERALDLQYTGSRTASGSEESVVLAGHEKEGTGTTHVGEEEEHEHKPTSAHKRVRTLSDATTATISPARASLHFRVPDGPLSIFALPGAGTADEKVVFSAELDKAQVRDVVRALEIVLDGVRVPVGGGKVDGGVASKAPGAAVLESFAPVRAGALEVLGGALL